MTRLTPRRSRTVAVALMTAVAGTVALGLGPAAAAGHGKRVVRPGASNQAAFDADQRSRG